MTERICNQNHCYDKSNKTHRKKTLVVVIITAATMVLEIVYGLITGSMALLADGIHMGTHTFALVITLIAFIFADKQQNNPNFAFSSGKIGVLGGYSNALLLGITAIFMVQEAIGRLISPGKIRFNEAIIVAIAGLVVNIVSAVILSQGHQHHHHDEHTHNEDHNLKAAYVHVITDAMTSILALIALGFGKVFGLTWPDAVVAIFGAIVILKWAFDLMKNSGQILVDYYPVKDEAEKIKGIIATHNVTLEDLHIWRTSESTRNLMLTLRKTGIIDGPLLRESLEEEFGAGHITMELLEPLKN